MKVKIYKFTEKGKVLYKEITYTKKEIEDLKSGNYLPKQLNIIAEQQRKLKSTYYPFEKFNTKKIIFDKLGITTINQKSNYKTNVLKYNSVFYNINKPLKNYLDTYNKLFDSIYTFDTTPILKHQKEVQKRLKEYLQAYKDYKNSPFYKEDKKEKDNLKKELKRIKKEINNLDNLITKKAYALLSKTLKQKPKPTTNKQITLNPNFDDFNGQIETIYKETQTLFISTLEQWKQLFSDDIPVFKKPIELKRNTTLTDLYYFFNLLYQFKIIKKEKIFTILEQSKSFSFKGKTIKIKQLTDAKQNYKLKENTKNDKLIYDIFSNLKLTD